MTRYEIKIGDTTEVTYGYSKENAYKLLIEKTPHYKFCIKADDLKQVGEDSLEEYLEVIGLDPFFRK